MKMRLWIECGYCKRSEFFYLGNNLGPNDLIVDFGDDTLPMVNVIKGARNMSHFNPFFSLAVVGGLIPCMPNR